MLEASPCGSKLVTTSWDGVYLWDAATGHLQLELRTGGLVCWKAAVSHGGARVVVWAEDQILVWDGVTGKLRRQFALSPPYDLLALLPGGGRAAAITASDAAMWDTESGGRLFALEGGHRWLQHFSYGRLVASSCGKLVAACGRDTVVAVGNIFAYTHYVLVVWDARSGRMVFSWQRRRATPEDLGCHVALAPLTSMTEELLD